MNWELKTENNTHYLTCGGEIVGDGFTDLEVAKRVLSRFTGPTTPAKVSGVMDNRHRNWRRRG